MTAVEINVPNIGVGEAGITEILVKVGNKVEVEQSLITVEGDKASIEVPSLQAGIIKEIKISAGDKTETGKLIMTFDSADGAATAASAQVGEKKEAAPAVAPAASVAKGVHVPDIGDDEAEVTEIMVKMGDTVAAEQFLIIAGGGKAPMEVPAPFAGTVKEVKINTGGRVSIGSLIMVFEVMGAAPAAASVQAAAPAAVATLTAPGSKEINISDISGDEVGVTEVIVKVGDKTVAEQPLITVEGDKASMEVPTLFAGTAKEIRISTGGKVKTDSLIMVFEVESVASAAAPTQVVAPAPVAVPAPAQVAVPAAKTGGKSEFAENNAHVHAMPLIHRLAREFGVNLTKVKGSGCKSHILREDVQTCVRDITKRAEAAPAAAAGGGIPGTLLWSKADFSRFGETEEVELGRTQKVFGANLSRNWATTPHATHFDKTGITDLEAFRKQQNAEVEKRRLDVKSTPVAFIMKAAAAALEQMPRFNSSLSEDGQRLTLKEYTSIDVAVDTPNGLVVPIFKDVNKKSITELSREPTVISKKTRDGKLIVDEMQGGCFTISSIGGLGTTHFVPIVNALEVAILDVSKSSMELVWNGKEFMSRLMMPISLSFDHRVIDGVDGTCFITIINNMLLDIHRLVI